MSTSRRLSALVAVGLTFAAIFGIAIPTNSAEASDCKSVNLKGSRRTEISGLENSRAFQFVVTNKTSSQSTTLSVVKLNKSDFVIKSTLGKVPQLKSANSFMPSGKDSYFINADFFDLQSGFPRSTVVSKGKVVYHPGDSVANLSLVSNDGVLKITRSEPKVSMQLSFGDSVIEIDTVNRYLNRKANSLYSRAWGLKPAPAGRATLVLDSKMKLVSFHSNGKSLAVKEGFVIQLGAGASTETLALNKGMPFVFKSSAYVESKGQVVESVGRGESLLEKGTIEVDCSPLDKVRPRTALGWDSSGNVWLVTATSGKGSSAVIGGLRTGGVTKYQLATLMQALGIPDAVNLDGGSSTNLWMRKSGHLMRLDDRESTNSREIATGLLFTKK